MTFPVHLAILLGRYFTKYFQLRPELPFDNAKLDTF